MTTFVSTRYDARRSTVEAFIRARYRDAFEANLEAFPPRLVAATVKGRITCAAGLRTEADGFFCEVYLDEPIDRVISRQIGASVARARLMEVTSLCSISPPKSLDFIRTLVRFGLDNSFDWSIFVATNRLAQLLRQMGLAPLELGPAKAEKVPDLSIWGNYYETSPVVMAVQRTDALRNAIAHWRQKSTSRCLQSGCPLVGRGAAGHRLLDAKRGVA